MPRYGDGSPGERRSAMPRYGDGSLGERRSATPRPTNSIAAGTTLWGAHEETPNRTKNLRETIIVPEVSPGPTDTGQTDMDQLGTQTDSGRPISRHRTGRREEIGEWPITGSGWPITGSRWPITGSRWPITGSRWPITGSRWPIAGSGWPITGSTWPIAGSGWPITGSTWHISCHRTSRPC